MNLKAKWILIFIILFSGLIDILTTIGLGKHESNPISLFFGGLTVAFIIKILGILYICYWIINVKKLKGDFSKFIIIGVSILLICGQLIAGINNVQVKQQIPVNSPGHVTMQEKVDASIGYVRVMFSIYAYPLMILAITFMTFYFVKKQEVDNK